ncbi:13627_t:CDS:1 [Entrophospora sp. SA101]|nr:13627_t:CDS:1 [Entrophospora sp. SA101]
MEKNPERACQLLTWIQTAIKNGHLRNPGIVGVKWLNKFLKKYESETLCSAYNLKPSDLRKIGADHACIVHEGRNDADRLNIRRKALRHSPDGPHSPAENYAIINDRRKILPSEPKDKVDRIPYNDLIEELD